MLFTLASLVAPLPAPEIIVVRAERLKEEAAPKTTISANVLQNQAGLRLDEALRTVPGFGLFRRTASGTANATIQGFGLRPIAPSGAGRALVSLDGVPQNDPFGGWIYWGRYDPLFLQQIDVRRGGAGAGFGPMALTGVLDMTQARGQASRFTASLGSADARHLGARTSVRTDGGAVFSAMGVYDASDGTIPVSARQRGPADQPADFHIIALDLVTDIARDNGAWSFRAAAFDERKGAGLSGGQSGSQGLDISLARRFEGDFGQSRFILYGQGRDFSNQTVAVTAGRTSTIPVLDQYATPSSALGGSFVFQPSPKHVLPSLTLDARRAEGQTRELFRLVGSSFTRARVAGGSQDLIGLGVAMPRPLVAKSAGLRLEGGFRLDYWANRDGVHLETDRTSGAVTLLERAKDKSGTIVTGRLSLDQTDGPFGLSFYRTFRPPSLNELHRPFRVGNDVTEANAALRPETLLGVDVDFNRAGRWRGGDLTAAVSLYVNRLEDPIATVTLATGPGNFARVGFLPAGGSLRERRNVGTIDAQGIEASANWTDEDSDLSWSLAGSWTRARVKGGVELPQLTGKRPAQAPIWSAIARLTLPIAENRALSIAVRGEGARFEDDLNTRTLAAYGALDIRASWRLRPKSEIYLGAENVLDTPIQTAKAGNGIVALAQGRVVRLGLTFTR